MKISKKNMLLVSIGLMFCAGVEAVRVTPGSVKALSFTDLDGADKSRFAKLKAALQDRGLQEGDLRRMVRAFLDESPKLVRVQDSSGTTLLLYAAAAGRAGAVEVLLDEGSDPQMVNNDRQTPLDRALETGNESVVNLLLEPFSSQERQRAPKSTSTQATSVTSSTSLTFSDLGGADKSRFTKIKAAIQDTTQTGGDVLKIVEALLAESPRLVHVQDSSETTLLSYAAGAGRARVVTLLLQAGSDPYATNKDKKSPLDRALESGNEAVVNLLLATSPQGGARIIPQKAPAQPVAVSSTQRQGTAQQAPAQVRQARVIRFQDLDAVGQRDFEAAVNAIKADDTAALRRVVQNKDLPYVADKFGNSLLILAAKEDKRGAVQLLLDEGADVNAADRHGNTALSYAARNGDGRLAQMLIDYNADPNLPDDTWTTPLARALIKPKDNAAVIDVLSRHGAKLYAKVALMLIPSEEYRFRQLKEPFEEVGKGYLSHNVRNVVALQDPTDFHISLVYLDSGCL
jgi:uncharacterized protein